MIDFKNLDCTKALEALIELQPPQESSWTHYNEVMDFILKVNKIQHKYTKPVAALLKKDANG